MPPAGFRIHVSDDELAALRHKLQIARLPRAFDDSNVVSPYTTYGPSYALLHDLKEYWLNQYDWRVHEAELNAFANFTTSLRGLNVHFIHERAADVSSVPVLLLHGWPGSVWEFHKIIPDLVRPASPLQRAFHVVAMSLPGYAWSEAKNTPGMDASAIADMANDLMHELGYAQYVAQGGDWGGIIIKALALAHPESCVAIHVNLTIPRLPGLTPRAFALALRAAVDLSPLGAFTMAPSDRTALRRLAWYLADGSGYFLEQSTKPMTLAAGLADSPIGLLGWLLEKLEAWTDCQGGDVLGVLSRDEILTMAMIYWTTNSVGSSMRLYKETLTAVVARTPASARSLTGFVTVPTAVAYFPKEIINFPRAWLALSYNLCHVSTHATGGHFAAWEQPKALADDMRAFFYDVLPFATAKRLADKQPTAWERAAESRLTTAAVAVALVVVAYWRRLRR